MDSLLQGSVALLAGKVQRGEVRAAAVAEHGPAARERRRERPGQRPGPVARRRAEVGTRLGERTMLRGYGGGAQALLQEPNSGTVRALFKHDVERALALFLPDARLTAPIGIVADQDTIRVSIQYVAAPDQVVQRLALTFSA